MEQRYGTDPSRRYGTGVWNGCGPGACSGPPILTCTHIDTHIYNPYENHVGMMTILLRFAPIAALCEHGVEASGR